jgi:hypothetical protein
MIQLLFQGAGIDQSRQGNMRRTIDNAEGHPDVTKTPENRLRHQQFIEIRVDNGSDDRVDSPIVIIDARGDVGHVRGTVSSGSDKRTAAGRVKHCGHHLQTGFKTIRVN